MDDDPLLDSTAVAALAAIQRRTWNKYVQNGLAPAADDPDADRPLNRRIPRWRASTIQRWKANRVGRGRRRDLHGEAAPWDLPS